MNVESPVFLLTGLLWLISSCGKATNSYDRDSLSCGSGREKQGEFFIVTGADGHRLTAEDIVLTSLDDKYMQLPVVSRNGCIKKPQAGRFLIKSKETDWAVIVDADSVAPRQSFQLLDFTGQSIGIECSETDRWTVGSSFSIQTLVKSNLEQALEDAFPVSFELKKGDLTLKAFKSLALKEASLLYPFNDNLAEGEYELEVTTKNRLKEGRGTVKSCKFLLDRTAPDISFSVNSSLTFSSITIQNTEFFAVVNPSENIEFASKDRDIKEVRYCLKELNDNFTSEDTEKLLQWRIDTQSKTCDSPLVNSTSLDSPLPVERRSGIWSIRYQGVDTFGNISAPKSTLFIFFEKDKLELTKNLAISDAPLFVLQNKSSQAASSALEAESLRVNLRTKYERELIKNYTQAGLITAFDQSGIAIRVDKSDRRVASLAIAKDSSFALAGSWQDNLIQIWNLETRTILTSLEAQDPVSALAVSPDGRTVYAGLASGKIQIIDKESKESTVIESHQGEVTHLRLSADGKKLVSSSLDKKIKVWEAGNLNLLLTLEDHKRKVVGLAITRDGSRLFSASEDGLTLVWDLAIGQIVRNIESGLTTVNALTLSNDEKTLALASENKIEVMKNDDNFSKIFSIDPKLSGSINQLSFSADDRSLISNMGMSTIQFWNMNWGFEERRMVDTGSLISSMAIASDGKSIVTGSFNSSLTMWEIETGFKPQRVIAGNYLQKIESLALSSEESFVVSLLGASKYLEVHYLTETDKPPLRLEGSEEFLTEVVISPQNIIIAGTDKGNIKIWESLSMDAMRTLTGHTAAVRSLAFIDGGSKLISGSDDQTLLVHDLSTGRIIKSFTLTSPIQAQAVSLSGTFVSAQKNGDIDLWDARTLLNLGKLKDPGGMLLSIDITDDGSKIVTGASNGVVRFWEVSSGKSVTQRSGSPERIKDVRWLPSRQVAITGSLDQTLRLWDATTGRNISTWQGHSAGVSAMTLNKDATLALVGSGGFSYEILNVWDLSQENLTKKLCEVGNVEEFEACKAF